MIAAAMLKKKKKMPQNLKIEHFSCICLFPDFIGSQDNSDHKGPQEISCPLTVVRINVYSVNTGFGLNLLLGSGRFGGSGRPFSLCGDLV